MPGLWDNAIVPFAVGIMDAVHEAGVREIVFVKSAQVAGTEIANNVTGYFMHADPAPVLYVAETDLKARAWSTECLAPMIRDTEALRRIITDSRERDSGNTIEGKSYPGGHLAIGWATSPATLSSRPRRVVILDERDAYKPTKEGDSAGLAIKRTQTFKSRKKVLIISTPRDRIAPPEGSPEGTPWRSPIELEYDQSDRRKYYVPCPECGELQVLKWAQLKWEPEDPAGAFYVCEPNGCIIEHDSKPEMLAGGAWIAEAPLNGRAGFWINELYSPFSTWGEMAVNFLEAKKNIAKLKVFINTSLAEGWNPADYYSEVSVKDLTDRPREGFGDILPEGVLVLVAGVDVQSDRLEFELVGYGLDEETWSIDYQILPGDPTRSLVWQDLRAALLKPYQYEVPINDAPDGAMSIQTMHALAAAVDTGGHHTEHVYRFVRANRGRRFYAVKGASVPGLPIFNRPTMQGKPPVKLYKVGTETAKDIISSRLAITEEGPGFCHFPADRDEKYFKQLRAERPVVRRGVRRWEKIRESARNEALDCRVYAMAAFAILRPNLPAIAAARLRGVVLEATPEAAPDENVIIQAINQKQSFVTGGASRGPRGRRGGGFVNNW